MILQSQLPQRCQELLQRRSILSSKPIQRNTRVYYTPNGQAIQSLQDIGNITKSVTDPPECSIELDNEEIRCGFVNTFEIVTRTSKGDVCHTEEGSIDILIQDVEGREVEYKLIKNQPGKYLVSYKAEKPSPYQINVSIAGHTIKNSPIKVKTIHAKADFKSVKIIEQKEDIKDPQALAVNNSHQAAIVDSEGHCIVIFSKDEQCLRKVGTEGTGDGELHEPQGVLTYEDKILVSDYPDGVGRIQEFHVNGTYLRTIYRQQGVRITRMCTAGDNISVLSYFDIDDKCQIAIKLFGKHSGQFVRDIPISTVACNENECPYFIAYGDNKYFLSYQYKDYISVHDDNGVFLYQFGDNGNQNGLFNDIAGLAVYGEDMLLACDVNNHRVQVFIQDGHFITSFGSFGSGQGQMNGPCDVAVTPDGKVFVLQHFDKRVQVWK